MGALFLPNRVVHTAFERVFDPFVANQKPDIDHLAAVVLQKGGYALVELS